MAYTVRSVTTAMGNASTFTLGVPAGAVNSDALYVFVTHGPGVQITVPDRWVLVASAFSGQSTLRVLQAFVLATSGPWTFTLGTSSQYAAAAVAVTADSSIPGATRPAPDVFATRVVASTTGPAAPSTITPNNSGDVMLYAVTWGRGSTFTAPGGTTEQVDVRSGDTSTDRTLWIGSQSNATVAGTPTSAISVTNDNPFALAAGEYGIITISLASIAPPSTWNGDFETGNLSQYTFALQAYPDRLTVRTDTPRQGTYYCHFLALDNDIAPLTPTHDPRAQLVSPLVLYPGTERWISWSTRFRTGFPVIPSWGWLVFFQYHGPPYLSSPPIGFGVTASAINITRSQTYGFDTIWSMPMALDQWLDFLLHVNLQQDETGYIELWINGEQQTFWDGSRRLYMVTVETIMLNGCEIDPTLYRKYGVINAVELDHDAVRMDTVVPSGSANAPLTAPPIKTYSADTASASYATVVG